MARKPDRFEKVLRRGRYLFHVHTDWTDGKSSLADYCVVAKKLGFQVLILTEHIRRECNYDFQALLELADEQRLIHGLEILVGVEAKILPHGVIDVPEHVLPEIEVLAIAEHSFQADASTLAESLEQAFESLRSAEFARVWVHPGLGLILKKAVPEYVFRGVLQAALKCGVYIEHNLRHKLPPKQFLPLIPPNCTVIGLDAHSAEEVEYLAKEALQKESELAGGTRNTRDERGI